MPLRGTTAWLQVMNNPIQIHVFTWHIGIQKYQVKQEGGRAQIHGELFTACRHGANG